MSLTIDGSLSAGEKLCLSRYNGKESKLINNGGVVTAGELIIKNGSQIEITDEKSIINCKNLKYESDNLSCLDKGTLNITGNMDINSKFITTDLCNIIMSGEDTQEIRTKETTNLGMVKSLNDSVHGVKISSKIKITDLQMVSIEWDISMMGRLSQMIQL